MLSKLPNAKRNGKGWRVRCPAHDGKSANSLAITEGDGGAALLFCHGGCETAAICRAIGIETRDLFVNDDRHTVRRSKTPKPKSKLPPKVFPTADDAVADLEQRHGKRSAVWTYDGGDGEPLGLVVRWDRGNGEKDFRPVSRKGSGWVQAGMKSPRPLYQLPDLADAERVFVCEGEKAADAARSLGVIATTSPHGSKSAAYADWQPLAGKDVVILPDNDAAGSKYADAVIGCLSKLQNPPTIKVVTLPHLPDAGDAADWIAAGGTRDQLDKLVEQAEQREPEAVTDEPSWLPSITWMDGVEEREWDWLWQDKIPLGALIVFHGVGDVGKSWGCIDMACRASRGIDWPGGVANTHGPIKSLFIEAEDDLERVVAQRIRLQEGDASKIGIMSAAKCGDEERLFSLQLDVAGLEQRIAEENIRLVFIDPIPEFYGEGVNGNCNEDVRRVLSPLVQLAQRQSVAIVALTHDGKRETDTARNKALGTVALVNTARVSFYFTLDPHDNNENPALRRRLMVPDKGNIFFEKRGLAYRWLGKDQPLVWDADPVTQSADQIMADTIQAARESGTPREQAKAFLRDLLADGPMDIAEVIRRGKEEGHAEATLKAAKRDMKVANTRHAFGGSGQWELPSSHSVGP